MRKTNLLYSTYIGEENSFLTFSNYTEAMTGNHLSVNTKMFPSTFLCAYINVTPDNIGSFINTIVGKYENKLAFLRDTFTKDSNISAEDNIYPLEYLIETIEEFDKDFSINYVGQVTEQDYNGTFCDTMCIISTEDNGGKVTLNSVDVTKKTVDYNNSYDYLYGWSSYDATNATNNSYIYNGPSIYRDVKPLFDKLSDNNDNNEDNENNSYNNSYIYVSSYKYDKLIFTPADKAKSIEFNCIIPLFDIVNVDPKSNESNITEPSNTEPSDTESPDAEPSDKEPSKQLNSIEVDLTSSTCNVPMGIWFSQGFNKITLQRDETSGFWPSWSLVLSSQFKPFPKSPHLQSDTQNISSTDAFGTFAQILVEQARLTDEHTDIAVNVQALSNRISNLESKINNTSTNMSLDALKNKIDQIDTKLASLTESLEKVNSLISSITWKQN